MFTLKIMKDMYILVSGKDIKSESVKKAYHERMPDGRLILAPQELKMLGSVESVQVVSTARELKELMGKPVAGGGTEAADESRDAEATDTDNITEEETTYGTTDTGRA